MSEDAELLNRYATDNSEAAFTELVQRHVDLVYSAALRLLNGDVHRAQDVTQQVFAELARRAGRLAKHPALAAWLYTTTRLMSRSLMRGELRRKAREQEATTMNELLRETGSETDWARLRPVIDDAMHELGETDRLALLVRFFQNKNLKDVGAVLNLNENAARMRVERALEKLRVRLARKGVTSTSAAALVAILTGNAITAAPATFVATLTSASLAGVSATSGTILTLLKLMTATKLKLGVASAVIVAAIFIALLLQLEKANDAKQSASSETNAAQNAMDAIAARREASMRVGNFPQRETNAAPTATPEEIVASKLAKFGRSRHDLVDALAQRYGIEVPDDVKRFFEAVDRGVWEEIDAAHRVLLASPDQLNQPRSPELHQIWRPIQEAWGAAREAHTWPAQSLLDYGQAVLGSLRPGMVYVGGTDPGAFITSSMNETSEGERHIVLTQNALADNSYLDYLNSVYGDRMVTLTHEDSQRAFDDYLADVQKRFQHDQQFPDEPKQMRPGENFTLENGKPQVSGQAAVMAINEKLFQMFMQKNPDMSFAMEVSFPFPSTYADASPLGPIVELRVQDEKQTLTPERAAQSVEYWRAATETLNFGPDATDSLFPRMAYAKMASEQAELLLNRGYAAEAEQTLRLANQIGSGSPEAFYRLVNLLVSQGRINDALAAAEATYQNLPSAERMKNYYGENPAPPGQMRAVIENLKRMQKTK